MQMVSAAEKAALEPKREELYKMQIDVQERKDTQLFQRAEAILDEAVGAVENA